MIPPTAGRAAMLSRMMVRHGGFNLLLRAATLFFRFTLSFYVVRFLGLEEAGIYGLAMGAIGIAPALIGWGLNYFVAREVVGMTPDAATQTVKSRLAVTATSLAAATLIAAAVAALVGYPITGDLALIVALIWLETLALDLYLPLIGLELATEANVVVFVRSALWVPPVIAAGAMWPEARSLKLVFAAWLVSHVLSLLLLARFLRRWPVGAALAEPVDVAWIRARLSRSWYIYLSDLGLVGQVFLDRYIVNWLLGIRATGIYVFYWSIANALQTLMQTAVVQLALPRLLKAYREPTLDAWQRLFRIEMAKSVLMALALALVIFGMVEAIVAIDRAGRFPNLPLLLALVLAAAVVRAASDLLNVGLTSTGRDRYYAATNVGGVILSVALSSVFLATLGLIGVGVAGVATALILVLTRVGYLRRVVRQNVARPAS